MYMTPDQKLAQDKLIAMRRSLAEWRAARLLNDELTRKGVPDPIGKTKTEEELKGTLIKYISAAYPDAVLPIDTLALAEMVIVGPERYLPPAKGPQAQGFFPLLILGGGLLIAFLYTLNTLAEKAKQEEERKLCARGVKAYCPQSSWWKWAAVAGVGYFIAKETTLFERLWGKAKTIRFRRS